MERLIVIENPKPTPYVIQVGAVVDVLDGINCGCGVTQGKVFARHDDPPQRRYFIRLVCGHVLLLTRDKIRLALNKSRLN